MDPNKLKETKKLLKRQSKLANYKRIYKLIFDDENNNLVICRDKDIYSVNNQFRNLPEDLVKQIKQLCENWITDEEINLNKDITDL